jgi:hypothetical protein
MRWDGVTPDQYDAVREEVAWEEQPPQGGILHVPWFADGALHITDVWETADDFQSFVSGRLMPIVQRLGIPGEPQVEIHPLHSRVFAPAIEKALAD